LKAFEECADNDEVELVVLVGAKEGTGGGMEKEGGEEGDRGTMGSVFCLRKKRIARRERREILEGKSEGRREEGRKGEREGGREG